MTLSASSQRAIRALHSSPNKSCLCSAKCFGYLVAISASRNRLSRSSVNECSRARRHCWNFESPISKARTILARFYKRLLKSYMEKVLLTRRVPLFFLFDDGPKWYFLTFWRVYVGTWRRPARIKSSSLPECRAVFPLPLVQSSVTPSWIWDNG